MIYFISLFFIDLLSFDDPSGPQSEILPTRTLDERKLFHYSNLFFLLQTEPAFLAALTNAVNLSEIDSLLQTVMFTIYGNQYENREEHLLLSMFQMVLSKQFDASSDFGSLLRSIFY